MSGITPGQIFPFQPGVTEAGRKDAFHAPCVIAKVSTQSEFPLDAGDHVTLLADGSAVFAYPDETYDGVVDPFITETIRKGSPLLFWVFLRPDRVTELTHTFRILPPTEAETDAMESPAGDDWNSCGKCNS